MITPVLRHIHSPDIEPPALPADPANCVILFQAMVGPDNGPGEEAFSFVVVTPQSIAEQPLPSWGRGYLLVREFSWEIIGAALASLLASARRPTWDEVGSALNRELRWEFDGRQG